MLAWVQLRSTEIQLLFTQLPYGHIHTHVTQKCPNALLCVLVCVCRFPIFTFKEIFNVIWKRSMQAHREPEELYNSGKCPFTVAPDLEHFTTLNLCTFVRNMKKAQERWKSRKG